MTESNLRGEVDVQFLASKTSIPGLISLRRTEKVDSRGSFSRLFDHQELSSFGWPELVNQVNFSITAIRGTVRGIHAQPGTSAEHKLVTCVRGAIWDVCVDLRKNSPTFLRWEAITLGADGGLSVLVPPGVAHGFQSLSNDVQLVYCHSAPYEPDSEIGVSPFDPGLAISWPLEVTAISDRDLKHPLLSPAFEGLAT